MNGGKIYFLLFFEKTVEKYFNIYSIRGQLDELIIYKPMHEMFWNSSPVDDTMVQVWTIGKYFSAVL